MKTLGTSSNFLAIEGEHSNLGKFKNRNYFSSVRAYRKLWRGCKTTGAEEILTASAYVEFYDDEFDRELCFDKGIATLEPIDFGENINEDALMMIETQADALLDMDKFVVTLGGEHTISIAPIKAHFKKYPNMSLLHFDAHSDLRESYEDSPFSHACAMSRVIDFLPPEKLVQVGIRAQCKEESILIKEKGVKTFYASAIRRKIHGENWQKTIVDALGDEIYITFDVDYFDPRADTGHRNSRA